jgi:hypothetical protein
MNNKQKLSLASEGLSKMILGKFRFPNALANFALTKKFFTNFDLTRESIELWFQTRALLFGSGTAVFVSCRGGSAGANAYFEVKISDIKFFRYTLGPLFTGNQTMAILNDFVARQWQLKLPMSRWHCRATMAIFCSLSSKIPDFSSPDVNLILKTHIIF